MEININKEKLVHLHMSKVEKAVRKNRLYFVCIEGCEHKVESVEEYLFLLDSHFVYQFYGI